MESECTKVEIEVDMIASHSCWTVVSNKVSDVCTMWRALMLTNALTDRGGCAPCSASSSCGCALWESPGSDEEQQDRCL